jgi:hypothetical protein
MAKITLDEDHFEIARERARELGKTPDEFIASLLQALAETFDDILTPVREGFRASGVTEHEFEDAVNEARKAIHQKSDPTSEK